MLTDKLVPEGSVGANEIGPVEEGDSGGDQDSFPALLAWFQDLGVFSFLMA